MIEGRDSLDASGTLVRFGTSSFSSRDWVGPVYPSGTKPGDFLRLYAQRYDTVEVDSTYYGVPVERTVLGWREKVPEGFLMAAKFPRAIVHGGEGRVPDGARVIHPDHTGKVLEVFLERMDLMGACVGPLLLQFPYFNRAAFASLPAFLERLDPFLEQLPTRFRYAMELRNRDWLQPELFACLARHRVAFALVEISYMPHPADLVQRMPVVTTDFLYSRLIGDRQAVDAKTKRFDRLVLDRSASLARWADLLLEQGADVDESLVYANNHYAGHGPATIDELRNLIDERRNVTPQT